MPTEYPFKPPRVKLLNGVIYHSNFSKHGDISIDILDSKWSPAYTVEFVMDVIYDVIRNPCLDCPFRPAIEIEYLKNRPLYEKKARETTQERFGIDKDPPTFAHSYFSQ